jgi:hypothetical protein
MGFYWLKVRSSIIRLTHLQCRQQFLSKKHGSTYGETFVAERREAPEYCAFEEHPHLASRARKLPIEVQ